MSDIACQAPWTFSVNKFCGTLPLRGSLLALVTMQVFNQPTMQTSGLIHEFHTNWYGAENPKLLRRVYP